MNVNLQREVVGERFGRLLVIAEGERHWRSSGGSIRAWLCRCDCGEEVTVPSHSLLRGLTRSCGCLRVDVGRWIGKTGKGAAARFGPRGPDRRPSYELARLLGYNIKEKSC